MTTDAPQTVHSLGTNMEGFADALDQLGRHAAWLASGDGHARDDCVYCQTTILLSRVVGFGDGLRHDRKRDAVTP